MADDFLPADEREDFVAWLFHLETELSDADDDIDDDGNAPLEYA